VGQDGILRADCQSAPLPLPRNQLRRVMFRIEFPIKHVAHRRRFVRARHQEHRVLGRQRHLAALSEIKEQPEIMATFARLRSHYGGNLTG